MAFSVKKIAGHEKCLWRMEKVVTNEFSDLGVDQICTVSTVDYCCVKNCHKQRIIVTFSSLKHSSTVSNI